MRYFAWLMKTMIRAWWAHHRGVPLRLSDFDADQTIAMLGMRGMEACDLSVPREIEAFRKALVRVRLGTPAMEALGRFHGTFFVVPSDQSGYSGPVRMVFVHRVEDFWTALPWPVPADAIAVLHFELQDVDMVDDRRLEVAG